MNSFANRVVVVTGAVGNLGLASARAFQQAGARTVLVDRSLDRLANVFADLVGSPDHLLAGGVDLGDEASIAKMISAALERFGRIDALIHTVGAWRGGKPVHEMSLEDWDFLQDANVRTTLLMTRAVAPHFLKQRSGKIVTVSARGGIASDANNAAYSASKAAVLRITESLSAELKTSGVNVNCVLPSTIDTPQNRAAMPKADHSKWVQPSAIADVILFLASDAARAVHGAAIPVYGLG